MGKVGIGRWLGGITAISVLAVGGWWAAHPATSVQLGLIGSENSAPANTPAPLHLQIKPGEVPRGLKPAGWQNVQAQIQAARYEISRDGSSGALNGENPMQAMRLRFTETGLAVATAAASPALQVSTASFGRRGQRADVRPATPQAQGNRVEYSRNGITEWFVNRADGVEHGYSVEQAPAGEGEVRIELALDGGHQAHAARNGITISGAIGTHALSYDKLVVTDAAGRHLPARLEGKGSRVLLAYDDTHAQYPVTVDPTLTTVTQQAKITTSDTAANDFFSYSVVISGNTLIAGSPGNGQGAAYVFTGSGSTWTLQQKLTASDGANGNNFGFAAGISADSNTVIVGAPGSPDLSPPHAFNNPGAAYVFVRSGNTWTQQAKLTGGTGSAGGDLFGAAVAVTGNFGVVGAPARPRTTDNNGNPITPQANAGQVTFFLRQGTSWSPNDFVLRGGTNDRVGNAVAISGNTVAVGIPSLVIGSPGAVTIINLNAFGTPAGDPTGGLQGANGDRLGYAVALDGNTVIAGAPGNNVAKVYVRTGSPGTWNNTQPAVLSRPADDGSGGDFGFSVGISGETAVVGNPGNNGGKGAGITFTRTGGLTGTWAPQLKLTASDGATNSTCVFPNPDPPPATVSQTVSDFLGDSIAISGATVVGGADNATTSGGTCGGAAYVFNAALGPTSVQLSGAPYTAAENTGTATITVARGGDSSGAMSVHYATSAGTAVPGTNYTDTSGTLNWVAGDSAPKMFNISLINTQSSNANSTTVNIALSTPIGGTLGTPSTSTLTITGSSPPGTLQFSAGNYIVSEGAGSVTITVTRAGGSGGAVSANYATSNNTAFAGVNYTATSGTLHWVAGDVADKTFSVPLTDTHSAVGTNTFVNLTLSGATGGATLPTPTSQIQIQGSGGPGSLSFSPSTYTAGEGTGSVTISVSRSGGTGGAVSVHYATSDGTAVSGTNYTATSGTLSWISGDSNPKTFSVPLINTHSATNVSKTVNLTLTSPGGGATLVSPSSATLTIQGAGSPGSVQFSSNAITVHESDGTATFTVTRTGGTSGAVGISYATGGGTAVAGTNYTAASGTLAWIDGDGNNKTFTVPLINTHSDSTLSKTVNLTLSTPTGGVAVGSPNPEVLTIQGAGSSGTLQFSAPNTNVVESAGTATITVTRTGGSLNAITVAFATSNGTALAGTNYSSKSGTLSWANGETANKTFTITLANTHSDSSSSKTVNLTLSSPTGGAVIGANNPATLTITGSVVGPGALQFGAPNFNVSENAGTATITVTRTGGSAGAVGVSYATSNGTATSANYSSTAGTLAFAAGETSKTFSVGVLNTHSASASSKTVNLTLSAPTGGATLGSPNPATLTIQGSGAAGTLQFSAPNYNAVESAGSATITVTRTGGSDGAASVAYATSNGTATGANYTPASGTLAFANGETSKTFAVLLSDTHSASTSSKTVNLTLSNATGATLGGQTTATLTITGSNNASVLQFSQPNFDVNENGGNATITVTRTGSVSGAVSVSYTTNNGTAVAGTNYTTTSGTLQWTDGDGANKSFAVPIIDAHSGTTVTKTVNLNLSNAVGATISSSAATITIHGSANAGTLQFSAVNFTASESSGTATITVTRVGGVDGTAGVSFATSDGTATSANYTATSGNLSWTNGDNGTKSFTVTLLNTHMASASSKTVNLTLSNATGATLGTQKTATLTIQGSGAKGTLQFSAATYTVVETGPAVTITVTRTGGSDGPIGVAYATSNGTATSANYASNSGTLAWNDGDVNPKSFTVTPHSVPLPPRESRTVNLALSTPTGGATLGTPTNAVLTITSSSTPSTLKFAAANFTVSESEGTATIIVSRAGGSVGAVSASFATSDGTAVAGTNYVAKSGTVSWANGDVADKPIVVNLIDTHSAAGSSKIVNLTLSAPTGATLGSPNPATLTIQGSGLGTLEFSASTYAAIENSGSATITVNRSGGSTAAVSVDYATSDGTAVTGTNYTTASGTLNFDAGQTSKTFTVALIDTHSPASVVRTVNLTLSNISAGATLGTQKTSLLAIQGSGVPGIVQFTPASYVVSEDGGKAVITVSRTGGSDGPVSVNYDSSDDTALQPANYAAAHGVLSWLSGDSGNKSFTVDIVNAHSADGSSKALNLTLSAPTGGAALGSAKVSTLTILGPNPTVAGVSCKLVGSETRAKVTDGNAVEPPITGAYGAEPQAIVQMRDALVTHLGPAGVTVGAVETDSQLDGYRDGNGAAKTCASVSTNTGSTDVIQQYSDLWTLTGSAQTGSDLPGIATLTGAPPSISLGQNVALAWTTNDKVASCMGNGAWSGNKPANGGENQAPTEIGTYSYTLGCVGNGKAVSEPVIVTVTPASGGGGGGGGGSLNPAMLLPLALAGLLRRRRSAGARQDAR